MYLPKQILVFSYITMLGLQGLAQQHDNTSMFKRGRIQHFTNENGLPQNTVKFLIQEKMGSILLATEAGLVRYDGKSFKNVGQSMTSHRITSMFLGRNDTTYIVDDIGNNYALPTDGVAIPINRYLGKYGYCNLTNFDTTPELLEMRASSMLFLKEWYRTTSGNYYFWQPIEPIYYWKTSGSFQKFDDNLFIKACCIGENLFLVDKSGNCVIQKAGPSRLPSFLMPGDALAGYGKNWAIDAQFFSSNGIAFAYLGGNIYKLSMQGKFLRSQLMINNMVKDVAIRAMDYDEKKQTIFISTFNDGLYIVSISPFVCRLITGATSLKRDEIINNDLDITTTQAMADKNTILGSNGYLYPNNGPIVKSLVSQEMRRSFLTNDRAGNLLYTTNDDGLVRAGPKLETIKRFPEIYLMQGFAETGDGFWAANERSELYHVVHDSIRQKTLLDSVGDRTLITIFIYSDTAIWIGSRHGIYSYNPKNSRTTPIPHTSTWAVRNICRSYSGHIWICTYGSGLIAYDTATNSFLSVRSDRASNLDFVHAAMPDNNGFIWMPTNNGLYQALEKDLLAAAGKSNTPYYYRYDKSNGFATNEFNGGFANAAMSLPDSMLSMVSMKGLVWFYPNNMQPLLPNSPLSISDLRIDGKSIPKRDKLCLQPDFIRMEVDIRSPYFGLADNELIEYRVVGLDTSWSPLAIHGTIHLANLQHGNYTLQVRKITGFGANNESRISIHFNVSPFFTQRPVFVFMMIALLVAIGYILYEWNVRRFKKNKIYLEKQVLERTQELEENMEELVATATELEINRQQLEDSKKQLEMVNYIVLHDLGSPLRFLGQMAERLTNNYRRSTPKDFENDMQSFQHASTEVKNTAADLLTWLKLGMLEIKMEKQDLSFKDWLESNLKVYTWLALEKGLVLSSKFVDPDIWLKMNWDVLGIVLRNLLDNAIKHTSFGEITVSSYVKDNVLAITVQDSGQGFSDEQFAALNQHKSPFTLSAGGHLGFRLIFDCLDQIGAGLKFSKSAGSGTKVELSIPIVC